MAKLGFHTVNEMIGQSDVLRPIENREFWKLKKLRFDKILYQEPALQGTGLYKQQDQHHELEDVLDW